MFPLYGFYLYLFFIHKPVLTLHCCSYNVYTNMVKVLLHVKLRRGRCTAAATKPRTLYTVYDNVAIIRMVPLTGALNKDPVWWLESPQAILQCVCSVLVSSDLWGVGSELGLKEGNHSSGLWSPKYPYSLGILFCPVAEDWSVKGFPPQTGHFKQLNNLWIHKELCTCSDSLYPVSALCSAGIHGRTFPP